MDTEKELKRTLGEIVTRIFSRDIHAEYIHMIYYFKVNKRTVHYNTTTSNHLSDSFCRMIELTLYSNTASPVPVSPRYTIRDSPNSMAVLSLCFLFACVICTLNKDPPQAVQCCCPWQT